MSLLLAHRCDAPSLLPVVDAAGRRVGDAEISRRVNPNTGALEFRAPLTWTGVRPYKHRDGTVTRELRRPEQVKSESHRRGLRLLTTTPDHPSLPDRTPVYLDARGGPGVTSPDGSALRPAEDYSVGHVGDSIEDGEIGGYYVPVGWCSITDLATQRRIAAGRTQTSLGYTALLDDTGGVWDGPHGPEEYDVEHVLDHADPRVQQAVADGVLPTVEVLVDGEVRRVPVLGPNHFAVAIWAGRGELQSEIVDFATASGGPGPLGPRRTDGPDLNLNLGPIAPDAFAAVVADTLPPDADAPVTVLRAARTARVDVISYSRLAPDVAAHLSSAPLSGHYAASTEWLGWVEPPTGAPGHGGIGFVAADRLGLWWPTREPDGGVVGSPVAFAWLGVLDPGGEAVVGAVPAADPALVVVAPAATCDAERPRVFSMIRQADESGVSGTGHVLDGVVWPAGAASVCWRTGPLAPEDQVPIAFSSWSAFMAIHVDQHPGNESIIAFDDGGPWPACDPLAPADVATSVATVSMTTTADGAATPIVDAPAEHSARQADPDKFNAFLRFALPNGASMIVARKGGGPWQLQSVRFPADSWKPAKAKAWLKAAGLSAAEFAVGVKTDGAEAADDEVSFVARPDCAPYAAAVRGEHASARPHKMLKLQLSSRYADTAGALATAVKSPAPAPVKIGDAMMLEVEWPEDADPAVVASGMSALVAAMNKTAGAAGTAEAQAAAMGADYATLLQEVDALRAKVDSLQPDAEVGRGHRLAQVVTIAKTVGLTDSDVAGKDADAVRTAAVAKRWPGNKHLASGIVRDSLWDVIASDAAASAPAAVAAAAASASASASASAEAARLRERPAARSDNAGDVVGDRGARSGNSAALTTHRYG